ncbi:hypothetical protein J2752_000948 [Halarchaeum rubridurum]|uniref:Uncharacterized protein n=1 Tax=Halarchaeum rubridurum TaxID=489911 RepID=A0A830FT31_9EURY|nr:hypothetical protein [Halarchaeum rubridurum]MBP1954067.1 hypothetical protein [Halarchaeum rubridurum]GGM57061.1 hypothetical protein GCM10009017_04060 [Halarchaeum rubridurum]
MVPWPLGGWSNPAVVAALVVARVACNVALTGIVVSAAGARTRPTAVAATLTGCSAALLLSVVDGAAGRPAGLLDLAVQVALLALAGHATLTSTTRRRALAFGALALLTVGLLLPSVVLYGEATVAP